MSRLSRHSQHQKLFTRFKDASALVDEVDAYWVDVATALAIVVGVFSVVVSGVVALCGGL